MATLAAMHHRPRQRRPSRSRRMLALFNTMSRLGQVRPQPAAILAAAGLTEEDL